MVSLGCRVEFWFLTVLLLPVLWWDLKFYRIPDSLTLGGLLLYLLFCYLRYGRLNTRLLPGLAAALGVYLPVYLLFPDRLGGGDLKLACLVGGLTGPFLWFRAHLFSLLLGILAFLMVRLFSDRGEQRLPFGPFICLGGMGALIFFPGSPS